MDGFAFLDRLPQGDLQPIYVLHGGEDFLKRLVIHALRTLVVGDNPDAMNLSAHPGDKAVWSAVHEELSTLPFLGGRRLVIIESADPFVTSHRAKLEAYFASPPSNGGILVLDVKTFAATTRLAKILNPAGNIECKAPATHRLPEWCIRWASSRHQKQLTVDAARLLVELIGPEMGLLDQELIKLSTYVGEAKQIGAPAVDTLVGNSRTADVWKVFEHLGAGKPTEAMEVLNRLFEQGNDAHAILGALSYQLRMLGRVWRAHHTLGVSLAVAFENAGIGSWQAERGQALMRHLGQRRLHRLFDWLLEVDLGLKGNSALPPRILIERIVVQLARRGA